MGKGFSTCPSFGLDPFILGGCPAHHGTLTSIPGLYPLGAAPPPPPFCNNHKCLHIL